ncbi:hypothetical protein ALQ36_05189 [Pseudomonas syringae pv. primulae]|uniref:Uncharacterized protein n=1 Tax=Pseudomonas syringae pv. primulae TaxID=251707 RepID=A0A3M3Y677_9PSED|nr:hypothetical protein ALQ36_05189 [Pseudomonas syringae pv. primulae]
MMQVRPEFVFADAGHQLAFHQAHACLGRPQTGADHLQFVGHLDAACPLQWLLSVEHLITELLQFKRRSRGGAFDGDTFVGAAAGAHQFINFGGPVGGDVGEETVAEIIGNRLGRADFVNGVEGFCEVQTAPELEDHHRAFCRNKGITRRVAGRVHLHVARASGVTHVRGVEQHAGGVIAFFQFIAYPLQTVQLDLLNLVIGRFAVGGVAVRAGQAHGRSSQGNTVIFSNSFSDASVEQLVAAHQVAFGLQVRFGQASVKLFGALGAADDSGLFRVGEDRGVTFGCTFDASDPMDREAAFENLQVAGVQLQFLHPAAVIAAHHIAHRAEVFLGARADHRCVLEQAASLGLLRHHADDEFVGVEVPGLLGALRHHIDDQARERVGVLVDLWLVEAGADEALHHRRDVQAMNDRVRANHVACHEAAGALHECAPGIILGQGGVVFGEVGVDLAHRIKRLVRERLTFCASLFQRFGAQEVF